MRKEWKTCTSTAHQGNQRIVSRRESVARGFIDRRRPLPVDRSAVCAAVVADGACWPFPRGHRDRLALSGRLRASQRYSSTRVLQYCIVGHSYVVGGLRG